MIKLRPSAGILTAIILSLGVLLTPQAANAAPAGVDAVGVYQELRNSHTNKCADVKLKSRTVGAIVHQFECKHEANQLWDTEPRPNGYVWLRNLNSGLCMAANFPYVNGDLIIQQGCTPDSADANWFISDDGGFFKLIQLSSGKCLDLNRGSTADGARIQLWDCDTSSNAQDWYFS
jgi:hypothetical protein